MPIKSEQILFQSMIKSAPVLLLGAGFSLGAQNAQGEELVLGKKLANKLFEYFFVDNRPDTFSEEFVEEAKEYENNLKYLCSLLRTRGLLQDRNDFLTDFFKGCAPKLNNHYHEKFTLYGWNKIFTLNVDDLVENIYRLQGMPCDVIDAGTADPGRDDRIRPKLIKLHGNISHPENGYVFDNTEYTRFTADQSPLLRLFGQYFSSNDVIILGTEFQEDDLTIINELYQNAGSDATHNYFFIAPRIQDLLLRDKIAATSNFHHIPWTTEEFIERICSSVVPYVADNQGLTELGVLFPCNSFHENPNYLSDIYLGKIPKYEDFLNNPSWDIRYPGLSEEVFKEVHTGKSQVIPLYGHQYCGKTCQLMRLLVNAHKEDFTVFELKSCSFRILQEVKEYLKKLPEGAKVAIARDDAASDYRDLVDFVKEKPSNIEQIIIFTADTVENHSGKRHYLIEAGYNKEYHVDERLNVQFAGSVLYELIIHKRLGEYQKLIPTGTHATDEPNFGKIYSKIKNFNDIIDSLYYASKGESFKKYYARFTEKHKNEPYWQYICLLCMLDEIGLSKIPKTFVRRLIPSMLSTFCFDDFLKTYSDILQVENGYIHVRGSQVLLKSINKTPIKFKESLYQLVLQTLGLFSEFEKNEYSDIYEKALRIKRIHTSGLLNKRQTFQLLSSLESTSAANYSYFWIQYGIATQRADRYDDANNHFLKAQTIRNSYSVQHALALNKLEKGYFKLCKRSDDAETIFLQGQQEMEELIATLNSPRTYSYLAHAYVNMLLKYYNKKDVNVPSATLEKMQNYIITVLKSPLDSRMNQKIDDFISYCKLHNKRKYLNGIKNVRRIVTINLSEEDYDAILGG